MLDLRPTRRQLLAGGGGLVVGFSLGGSLGGSGTALAKTVAGDEVGAYLAIAADGVVTVYTGKVDLGTGVRTAILQMAAEELDVPLDSMRIVAGDTDLVPDQGPTWSSLSIQIAGVQVRQAAATARKALVGMAAMRIDAPAADLTVVDGVIMHKSRTGGRATYGQIVGGKELQLKVDRNAQLKPPSAYKLVGQPIPRADIPPKATGQFAYMQDFRLPNMLHARVVFPPTMGSKLASVENGSVAGIPGIVDVVRIESFLAVLAETEWAAIKAARQLKAQWSNWHGLPDQDRLYEHVRKSPIEKDEEAQKVGNAKAALAGAAKKVSATYEFPIQTHGSLGPSCAVAEFKDGRMTVWSASESPHWLRKELSALLRMPESAIRVIYLDGAGSYGRNGHEDAAAEAALLARDRQRPVRVQWMRADEHGWDPKAPPALIDMRGGLDAKGNVVAWDSELWHPWQTAITDHPPLLAGTLAGITKKNVMNPGRLAGNAVPAYAFPNANVVLHRTKTTPFRPSWIRAPGRLQNVYAIETFMDELAAAAGADPVEFRLRHLKDARGAAAIKAAALQGAWEARPSPKPVLAGRPGAIQTGRGFAYARYDNRTYVAGIAEVEVDRRSGQIAVKRFVVAHDCGQIINPDGLSNQIEGCIVQTVSRTMKEELTFDNSRVTSLDWETYPTITFPEVPEVQIELIDRPDQPPLGAGEPAAVLPPPAISNAIFDATGIRLRRVPFTPERFKEAAGA